MGKTVNIGFGKSIKVPCSMKFVGQIDYTDISQKKSYNIFKQFIIKKKRYPTLI